MKQWRSMPTPNSIKAELEHVDSVKFLGVTITNALQ